MDDQNNQTQSGSTDIFGSNKPKNTGAGLPVEEVPVGGYPDQSPHTSTGQAQQSQKQEQSYSTGGSQSNVQSPGFQMPQQQPTSPQVTGYQQRAAIPTKRKGGLHGIGTILLFALLFAGGIGIGILLRQATNSNSDNSSEATTGMAALPTVTEEQEDLMMPEEMVVEDEDVIVDDQDVSGPVADDLSQWQEYQVLSQGVDVEGVKLMLPQDLLPPTCDGGTCASYGTYLPGGTRLTIAPRGDGHQLPHISGSIITDVGGQSFQSEDRTVAGYSSVGFQGTFNGTTTGGYAFEQMSGVLIELSDTFALEVNHFSPPGVETDFEADHELFEQILSSIIIDETIFPLQLDSGEGN